MNLVEIEKFFNRSLLLSCTKKKLLLTFPVVVLCGLLVVFFRVLAFGIGGWVGMSLLFLPILLCSGVLLSLGILLIRIYYHEVKSIKVNLKRIFSTSWQLILGTFYIMLLPVLIYLFLWIFLAIFMLLRQIPHIGEVFGNIFAFTPFLLIFFSIILCLGNIFILFFISPYIAFKAKEKFNIAKSILLVLKNHLFSGIFLFLWALFPIILVVILLIVAAILTNINVSAHNILSLAVSWFFIMLPFAAILTPCINFFFNFAAESYNYLNK